MQRSSKLLNVLCACLSAGQRGACSDDPFGEALTRSPARLMSFARLADRHLVTPMLAGCTARPEIRRRLPEDFRVYIDFFHQQNLERNESLRRELMRVAACLNDVGIEPTLLKGAIRLADDLYPDLGWRFMRDIDILVPAGQIDTAIDGMKATGYRFTCEPEDLPDAHRHVPALKHDDSDHAVELHAELLNSPELLPVEPILARSKVIRLGDARCRVPDVADQLRHLIGHDRYDPGIGSNGKFLLRSVFETAVLCREENAVDLLLRRSENGPLAGYAQIWLALTARLFPEYFASPPEIGRDSRIMADTLLYLERGDQTGRLRQLVGRVIGYGGRQLGRFSGSNAR